MSNSLVYAEGDLKDGPRNIGGRQGRPASGEVGCVATPRTPANPRLDNLSGQVIQIS